MTKALRVDEPVGPFASPPRAAEIALMEELGLPEFTELTGVGVGKFSIYLVSSAGVSLPVAERLGDFTPYQQHQLHQAVRKLALAFPCTPAQFLQWHERTRASRPHPHAPPGAPACSDFPLATGFMEALSGGGGILEADLKGSVPSGKIVAAFRVKPDAAENAEWWQNRMRHALRYQLNHARASRGRAKTPSRWLPLQIAAWLVAQDHLSELRVRRAVEEHFPEIDSSLL